MKKSDIAMIIFIASASILVSYFIAKSIFGDVYNGTAVVKTIEKIEPSIVEPSAEIFNENAINPTVPVNINGTKANANGS